MLFGEGYLIVPVYDDSAILPTLVIVQMAVTLNYLNCCCMSKGIESEFAAQILAKSKR